MCPIWKNCAKIIPFFDNFFFKNFTLKYIAQTSFIVQSQSKKYDICRYGNGIQYS